MLKDTRQLTDRPNKIALLPKQTIYEYVDRSTNSGTGTYYKVTLPSRTYDQLAYSLDILPRLDTPYTVDELDEVYNRYGVEFNKSTSNFLVLAISSNKDTYVPTIDSLNNLNAIPTNSIYELDFLEGTSCSFYIGIGCLTAFEFINDYDITNLVCQNTSVVITQVAGVLSSKLNAGEFKLWKVSCGITILNTNLIFSFKGLNETSISFKGVNIKSIYDDVIKKGDYVAQDLFSVNVKVLQNPNNYIWQNLLAELSYSLITTGTYPTTSSQLLLGAVPVNSNLISNFVLRTVNTPITITSITATIVTTSITMMKLGVSKDKVADDYKVTVINTLLELPSFSGVSLSKTVTVDITLDILGELRFKVDYKPTIKVVPTMLTTASASVAAIINSNRRLQITVKGYISDPASIITIGDVIELKGSVV